MRCAEFARFSPGVGLVGVWSRMQICLPGQLAEKGSVVMVVMKKAPRIGGAFLCLCRVGLSWG